jgi:hypothetical protein
MKEIKAYLNNQKDIYTMLLLEEMKSKQPNLAQMKYFLDKVCVLSEELTQINKEN